MQFFHSFIYTAWVVLFSVSMLGNGQSEETPQKCPVDPSRTVKLKYFTMHAGQKIYFCCAECIEEFNNSPDTYLPQIESKLEDSRHNITTVEKAKAVFDTLWNTATRAAGVTIVILLFIVVALIHFGFRKFTPGNRIVRYTKVILKRKALPAWALLLLAAETVSAHVMHHITIESIKDSRLEHAVHYTTFVEYGDPPLPSRPKISPRVNAVFYRGNDERNPSLFNGGNYRTATFHLDLCTQDGQPVIHGDPVNFQTLYFRVRFQRAAGTPDYFWKPARMENIYASRDPGKFHWRTNEPDNLVPMKETVAMQEWEFLYPISVFTQKENPRSVAGTFYICEKRFSDNNKILGGRFHCAFSFDLRMDSSVLAPHSDIWMGALYRKRSLRIWEIPESEWLSPNMIPEITGKQSSKDPVLLGIKDHEKNQN